jgi:regulator of protease activity HflC (stomatin/prohibitin superfamily)
VFLGLQGIHPPTEVAADYQKVIGAVQNKQAIILRAQTQRNATLSATAGSVQEANRLYDLALRYRQTEETGSAEDIDKAGRELDSAFAQAKGAIFNTLREAQSYAFEKPSRKPDLRRQRASVSQASSRPTGPPRRFICMSRD